MPALSWVASALLLASTGAAPWSVEECVAASEEGQLLQQKGALLAAKAQLELCSHASCPAIVAAACTGWLDEVRTATPTLIVVARLDGVDQAQAQVRLDDQPWLTELDGKPQAVDPGEHRISVELAGQTQQQRLVVNVGEKNRLVLFQLKAPEAIAAPAPVPGVAARPAPVVPLLLSGVTVVGVGLFAGLGLSGRNTLAQLNASPCATTRTCSPSSVAAISRTFVAADVALAVGVVAAVGAVWQWWRWSSVEVTPVVTAGGGGVVLHGRW